MKTRFVVWFKDGCWYCADICTTQTTCYTNKQSMSFLGTLIRKDGGAEYWTHCTQA